MEKVVIEHFQERVEEYSEKRELIPFPIDFEGRILEVGCGARPCYSIEKINYYGVDITPALIRSFREGYPSANLTICSVIFLPFKQNSYQLIVANNLLHHLIGNTSSICVQNVRSAMSELNRVLSSESVFIIKELVAKYWIYTQIMYYVTSFCAKYNLEINLLDIHSKVRTYFLTKKKIISLLKENTFQIEKISSEEWKLIGFILGSKVEIHARAQP